MRNVRLAFRTLLRTPFVTGVAVLSLALGIGANTAIFSLTDQVLLRPLPVPQPQRLVNLTAPGPIGGSMSTSGQGGTDALFSYPMFKDLERRQSVLSGLAAHRVVEANLDVRGETLSGHAALVSGSYFRTLGLSPALGRLFGPEDDATIGADFVAVLSYGFWHARLGADSSILGRTIAVGGQSLVIVGVAPRGFEGTSFPVSPQVFVPLSMSGKLAGFGGFEDRRAYWLYLFGRLKPGVTPRQAQSALNGIYRPILSDVEAPLQVGWDAPTLATFTAKQISLSPGFRGQSDVHRYAKTPLVMLLGVTAVVLLIACANIANLLLARGAGRAKEMGMRRALGAARRHLVAQLLTESVILALAGGAASLPVASFTLALLASLLPAEVSGSLQFTLQPAPVAFAAILAVATGLLFGLFPAVHGSHADPMSAIRASTGQLAGHRGATRFRSALMTAQIALATGLLILAGLFLKSLVNVAHVDLGVQVNHVVTFAISPSRSGYEAARSRVLFDQVEEQLAGLPGVSGVTSSAVGLLKGNSWASDVSMQGAGKSPDGNWSYVNEVGAGYFRMLGVPVLAGREFAASDALGSARVAVVNQAFARKFQLGDNAIHRYMSFWGSDSLNVEIVGLVPDAAYSSVRQPDQPLFFIPWRQDRLIGVMTFYVRSTVAPEQQLKAIPALMGKLAPGVPLDDIKTMREQVRENVFLDRLIGILSTAFAALATLLAAVGLYGVVAYTVERRTPEIGVRIALGADAWTVRTLVLRQVGILFAIGGALGIGAALGVGRILQSLLFGLHGNDPLVLVSSVAGLGVVAFSAIYVPMRRATRVDPIRALRYE